MKEEYDGRGLCYRDYKQMCEQRGKDPLPPERALELAKRGGKLDWELAAYETELQFLDEETF